MSADDVFGVYRGKAITEWLSASLSRDESVRTEAIQVLSHLDASFIPELVAAMGAPDDDLLPATVATLRSIGLPALPYLIEALSNENARIRVAATHALAEFGETADAAVSTLADALSDTEYVSRGARSALFAIVRNFHDLDEPIIRKLAQGMLDPVQDTLLPVPSSLRLDLEIEGTESMTIHEIAAALERGAKFVSFEYCISFVVIPVRAWSKPYFITSEEDAKKRGAPYTKRSLLYGWWGFPFGPVFTLEALSLNRHGKDVTPQMIAEINERLLPYAEIDWLADALEAAPGGRCARHCRRS